MIKNCPEISEVCGYPSLLQMTLTIFMFGYALSMLIAGSLSDILGRKRVLMYGLIIYLVATVACAVSTSIVSLIIARFFQALGGCCGTVIARVMVKDAYCREKQIKILSHLSHGYLPTSHPNFRWYITGFFWLESCFLYTRFFFSYRSFN